MRLAVVVALTVVVAGGALGETGSRFERHVERLVAMPTPLGPVLLAGDEAAWRVEVPAQAVVFIEAQGEDTMPFLLRATREGAAQSSVTLPTTHAGFLLGTPGAWIVTVDPLVGVAVDIRVTFEGHVADAAGGPADFTLTETETDARCVVPGVCLA